MQSVITRAQPFGLEQHVQMPLGMSVSDICKRLYGTIEGVVAFVRCPEGARQLWEIVPRDKWERVKPIGENCLKFEFYPTGGKSSNLFAVVASVLVSIAAPYLATTVLGFTAGSFAATAATAAIAIGGNLLVAKLFQPQVPSQKAPEAEQAEDAFTDIDSDANVLAKGIAPPTIHGYRRVVLPDLCNPHKYLQNGVDVIERVIGATGYHAYSDLTIDDISIDTLTGVTYQVRDGQESAAQQTLIKRVTKTYAVGQRLTPFILVNENQNLVDQVTPVNSEPQQIAISPGFHPDMEQITVRLGLEPFLFQTNVKTDIRYPIRITLKDKAGVLADIKLPEIHITGRKSIRTPKEIRIRRDSNFGFVGASSDFNYTFYRSVPATSDTLSDESTGIQWTAHSSFSAGSGISDTKNISGTLDSINVVLPPNDIPWADFEIVIVAGFPVQNDDFNVSNYKLEGTVRSLFKSSLNLGSWEIPYDLDGVFAGASVDWMTLIVARYPVETPGIFQIAMEFRGTNAKNISCMIGAYVNDWGGAQWDNLVVTKNPAPHYRHVLRSGQAFSRVSHDLNDDAQFLAWRTECASKGYECNFVASGHAINEVLGHIATAGFATKSFGTGYSIAMHKDRTAETPEMTFSHRDSKISYSRTFADSPMGYLVEFDDETDGYQNNGSITINNPYGSASLQANEVIAFPSITNPNLIRRWTMFNALQEAYRNKLIKIETGPAGFNRKRGDLVGVVSDLDSDYSHGFFIRQVLDARTVAVDRAVPVADKEFITDYTDITIEEEITGGGQVSTAHILTPGGMEAYTIADVTDNVIRFTSDIPESWTINSVEYLRSSLQGSRMTVAANENLFKRCLVLDVVRQGDQQATIYAVEEKPEIDSELTRLFG